METPNLQSKQLPQSPPQPPSQPPQPPSLARKTRDGPCGPVPETPVTKVEEALVQISQILERLTPRERYEAMNLANRGFERREGDIKDLDLTFLEDHALTIHLMSRKSEFYHILYRQRVRRGTAIQIIEKYDPIETTARVYHVDPPGVMQTEQHPASGVMQTEEYQHPASGRFRAKKPKVGTKVVTFVTKDGTIQVSQDIVDKHNQACDQLPLLVAREKVLLGNGAVDSSISSVREEIKFHLGNLCPREQELAPHIFKKLPY
tara:strand:- start:189 stop:974 length:786 start_codon:yes stop_codon:yes gene_type:complete